MSRRKTEIDESKINIEIEFVGDIDVYKFFNNKALEIIEKINKL